MEDKDLSQSCRDCVVTAFQKIIDSQFQLIRIFIYVLSSIALSVGGSEVVKNIWSVISK